MNHFKAAALLVFILSFSSAYSEDAQDPDGAYVDKAKPFTVKTEISRQSFRFTVKDTDKNRELVYEPNAMWVLGLDLSYYNTILFIKTVLPSMAGPAEKGTTKYYDLQASSFERGFGYDIMYQDYKGFYVDSQALRSTNGNYRVEPDLHSKLIGVNLYFTINPEFSYAAAFHQTERQIRSAGSFLIMPSFKYNSVKNSRTIIQPEEQAYFKDLPGLSGYTFYSAGLSVGYAYTISISGIFITPAIAAGDSIQYQSFDSTSATNRKQWNFFNLNYNAKISAGYNGAIFFAGGFFMVDYTQTGYRKVEINPYTINFNAFAGLHF